ncbi:craniofacial development protein 1 [Echeneis naucrates]|uniref:Craniofacial development protein 1 n=1 Tax=Echeneis naucrates TaxID=173247 RepID=A0A665WAT8_ECHNA|nr:craniofacial development protein 1 [Echeneis naucrates]
MNYSDYDSDGYSSNEDADYVPSDSNMSEDDINQCEKEDPLCEDDDVPQLDDVNKKKRKKKEISIRKRKNGVLKIETEVRDGDGAAEPWSPPEELVKLTEVGQDDEAKQKKKSDDLWANFLSDVGSRPKDPTRTSQSSATQKAGSSGISCSHASSETKEGKAEESATVIITKVFDFAGEEVRVSKEVSTDSREAKIFLKRHNTKQDKNQDQETSSPPPPGPSCSVKRPAGMSSVLSRLGGKKQKMSTLEKSKMDWDAFKSEEGITEELAIHNRGREGYVERKNFLERVDHRQFELEKAVRLSNMK